MNKRKTIDLANIIEETKNILVNRLIMENLVSKNEITIEEAQRLDTLTKDVLFEAMEEFIPQADNMEDTSEENLDSNLVTDDLILKDDTGNTYIYHADTGTLELTQGADSPITPLDVPDESEVTISENTQNQDISPISLLSKVIK